MAREECTPMIASTRKRSKATDKHSRRQRLGPRDKGGEATGGRREAVSGRQPWMEA